MGKCVLPILIVPNSLIFKDTNPHYYCKYPLCTYPIITISCIISLLVNTNNIFLVLIKIMWTGSQYEALFGLCKQLRSSCTLLWHSLSEIDVCGIRNFALAWCVCMNQSSLLIQLSKQDIWHATCWIIQQQL